MMLFLQHKLSRRERQIMDVLYRKGRATAAEILGEMPDAPSNSAVRAMLRVLEEKKHVRHEAEDLRYVYMPVVPREKARRSAAAHLVDTFFDGSTETGSRHSLECVGAGFDAGGFRPAGGAD